MRKKNQPGCKCSCGGVRSICARAVICGCTGANGATVTATGPGGFNQSGTTDATGWWCHGVTTPGTYTVTLTYGTYSATQTVVVGTPYWSYSATFSVLDGPLYLTTGLGTITLTGGAGHWTGTRAVSVSTTLWAYDPYGHCVGTPGTYSEPISYNLWCVPWTLAWVLTMTAPVTVANIWAALGPCDYGPAVNCLGGVHISGSVTMAKSCALPFSISGTLPSTWDYQPIFPSSFCPTPALDTGTVVITQ
jgi:hypothetical protein